MRDLGELEQTRRKVQAARSTCSTETDPAIIEALTEAIDIIDDVMVEQVRRSVRGVPDYAIGLSELLKDMKAAVALSEQRLNGVVS